MRACSPAWLVVLAAVVALAACADTRRSKSPASGGETAEETTSSKPAGSSSAASVVPTGPASSSSMPPPTPRKAGCLDSTRGAKHTFVGKLEPHPDGSGNWRVHLPKKVCFSGGRFSEGTTDDIILDIEDFKAKALATKKVKVSGTSQDFAPISKYAYVIRLEVTSLAVTK